MKNTRDKGITLIALVITIIILLILAGVAISSLGGENGLIAKAQNARETQIKAEMKEQLVLSLQELQVEKTGKATLDDVTQEWLDSTIEDYNCSLTTDASISGKKVTMQKDEVIGNFLIDEKLNVIEIEDDRNSIKFSYEVKSKNENIIEIVIKISDTKNGLEKVECPNGNIIECNGTKEEKIIDYEVELEKEYKFKIISKSGEEKSETIRIDNYYYTITKNLGEGISIDNSSIKAAYNKAYTATLTAESEYIIDTITVKMGGQEVAIDETTGMINIEKVTGDIEITATSKKLDIQITTPIINTTTTATTSVADNSQILGTTLYINFSATLEGSTCTILNKDDNKSVPYSIISNGTYIFIITGTYKNKTITKEERVVVNKYEVAAGFVQYDAGEWTKEEIEELQNLKLYDLNEKREVTGSLKLDDDNGKNLTFGGFTYQGDIINAGVIESGSIITSRNKSISPQSGYGTPKYDGWRILETKEKNGKTYITKLIHAGCPENFTYYYPSANDGMAKYILYSGLEMTSYNKSSSGKTLNPRSWDMYKDKELDRKGYIKNVHCLTHDEYLEAGQYNTGIGVQLFPIRKYLLGIK